MTILRNNISFRSIFVTLTIVASNFTLAQNKLTNSPEIFIESIYDNHRPLSSRAISFDNKEVLLKYFDDELTRLFIKDDECKKRAGGICSLDFDPIYDAQDFEENTTILKIKRLKIPSSFEVTFNNLGVRKLIYKLTKTNDGWRISDIKYPEGHSLKEILSSGVK